MKTTALFVILQYLLGFCFAIAGIFLFAEYDRSSLSSSIFLGFLIGFSCMLTGVGLAGYFHLKAKHVINRFGQGMLLSFAGLLLFLILYLLIEGFLPSEFGILSLLIPLTGAVFGFNLAATKETGEK